MTDAFDPGRDAVATLAPGAAAAADPPRGPGQRLRQARLRRGLELRQVAREMRLTVERVQAIEEDDYAALPDPVFVIGYLKTYARLMDLNPEALVAAYRTLQARSPVPPKLKSAAILPRVKPSPEVVSAKPAATPLPGGRTRGFGRFGQGSSNPGSPPSGVVPSQERERSVVRPEDQAKAKDQAQDQTKDKDQTKGQTRHQDVAWATLAAALLVLLLVLAWWTQRPETTPAPLAGGREPVAEHLTQPRPPREAALSRELPVAERSAAAPWDEMLTPDPAVESPVDIQAEIAAEAETEVAAELIPEPVAEEIEGVSDLPDDTAADDAEDAPVAATAIRPPEADVAQVVDKLKVVIRFSGPTSVDIRDSTMNYALVGEMDKGDQYLLGGKPPYSLIIGNAAAVELLVGGKPFDFQTVVRGNVARFILDPAPAPAPAPATPTPKPQQPRP